MTARVYCSLRLVLLCLSACLCTTLAGVAESGQCPVTLTVVPSKRGCTCDRDCSGGHKCCQFPCGPACVPPVFMKPAAVPPKPAVKPAVKPAAVPPKPAVKPVAEPLSGPDGHDGHGSHDEHDGHSSHDEHDGHGSHDEHDGHGGHDGRERSRSPERSRSRKRSQSRKRSRSRKRSQSPKRSRSPKRSCPM